MFAKAPCGTPIIGIVGWKKSGKTTLAVRLIKTFTQRGLKVASVKHAHHAFHIDEGHTDSARHRVAGAQQVAIVSNERWAIVSERRELPEPDFEEVIAALEPADIIVVEGYKSAAIPKIEARRVSSLTRTPLADGDPLIIAIAADHEVSSSAGRPVFNLDDIDAIADHIDKAIGPLHTKTRFEARTGSRRTRVESEDGGAR